MERAFKNQEQDVQDINDYLVELRETVENLDNNQRKNKLNLEVSRKEWKERNW